MALFFIFLCISLTLLNLLSGTLAQVCSSSTYSTLLGLSTYAPAESYCSSLFPQTKVKTTVTVTSISTSTTLVTAVRRAVDVVDAIDAKTTTTTVTATSTAGPCTGPCSTLSSITATQPAAFQSTFCSCIESPPTKTVTKTITSLTTKTTKTKTKTVTTVTTVTPAPTNEITDGGFENGGISWGFGGGRSRLLGLFLPQANSQGIAGQSPNTTPGPAYCNFAVGYVGNSTDTVVPLFSFYANNALIASFYPCGDGNGNVAGGPAPCILNGNAHYQPTTATFTQTNMYTYTDFDFNFLFSDPNASSDTLTALLDDVSCYQGSPS